MSAKPTPPYNTFNCSACGKQRTMPGSAIRLIFGRRTRICGQCKAARDKPSKEPSK